MVRPMVTCDGNEAAARIAHLLSEVIAIYPITPSSLMTLDKQEEAARELVAELREEAGEPLAEAILAADGGPAPAHAPPPPAEV